MLKIVVEAIAEHLNLSESKIALIDEETKLKEDLEIDSLDAVEISMLLEDKLEVEFDEADMDGIETVGDLVKAIEDLLN